MDSLLLWKNKKIIWQITFRTYKKREIVSCARRKNKKGHRYNEDWLMLCLLLHIRSPKQYRNMQKNNNNYRILQLAFLWLNNWESNVSKKLITKDEFLPNNTTQGLRVTIKSTMDITDYLISKYDFDYILTGRLNQDSLEVSTS
ncbi:uncharacterized protein LOC113463923 [Ceratina calcarata]|uniref:Uncharacterized protein LOC113463923 n=1 Tax=Ceratina calcarata TaxID=156304 RepID=A0AAJ7RX76_9HYME|nr:uncharacterized protein LOC113463923 [Ceratina calcarata]